MESIILPVSLFVLTMAITPGPNNMLLTASGARFGYLATLPHIAGIILGMLSQLLLSALGMGLLFARFPAAQGALKVAGTLYILYLAWKIAFTARAGKEGAASDRPFSVLQGAAFQYLNPKAYVITLTAMTVYPLPGADYLPSVAFIAAAFAVIAFGSISLWALFGSLLNGWMKNPRAQRRIRAGLGLLTAGSAAFILH